MACPAVGFFRTIEEPLAEPYLEAPVIDQSGNTFFVARPEGLVELADLAPEWRLELEEDLPESPNGRWLQAFSRATELPHQSGVGRLDFIQAFDGPASVSGGQQQPNVEVAGTSAELWTWADTGEIVLNWRLGGHGLALVANEADFSVDELIELAASAALPDGADT